MNPVNGEGDEVPYDESQLYISPPLFHEISLDGVQAEKSLVPAYSLAM